MKTGQNSNMNFFNSFFTLKKYKSRTDGADKQTDCYILDQ